jgi:hypothetical protein
MNESQRMVLEAWRLGVVVFCRPSKWVVELTDDGARFIEPATGRQFDIRKSDASHRIQISRLGVSGVHELKHLHGHLMVMVRGVSAWNPFRCVFEGDGLVQLSRWLGLPGWGCCPSCRSAGSFEDQAASKLTTCSKCGTVYPAGLPPVDVDPSGEVRFGSSCPRCYYPIPASDLPEPASGKHLACPRCGALITTTKELPFQELFDDMYRRMREDLRSQGKEHM